MDSRFIYDAPIIQKVFWWRYRKIWENLIWAWTLKQTISLGH